MTAVTALLEKNVTRAKSLSPKHCPTSACEQNGVFVAATVVILENGQAHKRKPSAELDKIDLITSVDRSIVNDQLRLDCDWSILMQVIIT